MLGWDGSLRLWGHGRDGADLALLDVLADRVPARFAEVVVVSGDGIFTDRVADLVAHGVHVTVVAHGVSLSARLAAAASEVQLLSPSLSPLLGTAPAA